MIYTLENEVLKVEISTHGAELQSIIHKDKQINYLWDAKPEVWGRYSPVLFPNCGRVVENKFIINGKEYPAMSHGFNRDMEHMLCGESNNTILFCLKNNDETKKYYPYDFIFFTKYVLENNRLVCTQEVCNESEEDIYFNVGFHTGIICPFLPNTQNTDYYLEFEKLEQCKELITQEPGFIIEGAEKDYSPSEKTIPLAENIFSGTLILEDVTSQYIDIKCKNENSFVRIGGTDSPNTLIWTAPENGLDLICIEPWYGKPDYVGTDHIFETKEGIIKLAKKSSFACSQYIEIHA